MGKVRVGCSGWVYDDWRGRLYPSDLPQSRWLEAYAATFDTVEVNATFYRLPTLKMVEGWLARTPPDFCFAIKASRYLTHVRRLRDVREGFKRLLSLIEPLIAADRLAPILWQLPPNFVRDDERLASALDVMTTGRHSIEFRHPSWFADEVLERLRKAAVCVVLADDSRRPLPDFAATADFSYVRFHYGHRGRRGNYSATELDQWAEKLRGRQKAGDLFVYFNNDWEGFAVENALGFRERLGSPIERPTPDFRDSLAGSR